MAFGAGAATLALGPVLASCGTSEGAPHHGAKPYYKGYFFKGSQYSRFNVDTNRVDPGYPKPISRGFPGVFESGLDAVTPWPGGKMFFFKDSRVHLWDLAARKCRSRLPEEDRHGLSGHLA